MATAGDVINNVCFRLEEDTSDPIFWSRTELLNLVNEGMLEFTLISGFLSSEQTYAMISAKLQAVPAGAIGLMHVAYSSIKIEKTTVEGFDRNNRRWDYQAGVPPTEWAPCGCDRFVINKHPSAAANLTLTTLNAPTILAESDTMPVDLEYVKAIEDYVFSCARFKEGGQEFQEAMPAYDDFATKAGMRERRTFSQMFVLWSRLPSEDTGLNYSTLDRS